MKRLLILTLIIGTLLSVTSFVSAKTEYSEFKYNGKLERVNDSSGFFIVEIEPKIYATMDNQLRDLRIYNQHEMEVGYIRWGSDLAPTQETYNPLQIINKGPTESSDKYSFTLKGLPSGAQKLTVKLNSAEYLVKAEIYGSNDNRSWQNIGIQTLYGINGNYNSFGISDVDYEFIKFEYPIPKEYSSLQVTEAGYTTQKPNPSESKSRDFPVTQTSSNKSTILNVDLGNLSQNSVAIRLNTNERNFYRQATVEASNDGKVWTQVSSFYIFRGTTQSDENTGINYPLTQARYLKITISNADNRPIKFQSVSVDIVPVKILVKGVESEAPFNFYWGNPKLSSPIYDIESVLQRGNINPSSLPVFRLKENKPNSAYQPSALPITERFPFLLPLALVLGVIVVGVIQYRSFKKVE